MLRDMNYKKIFSVMYKIIKNKQKRKKQRGFASSKWVCVGLVLTFFFFLRKKKNSMLSRLLGENNKRT